MPNIVSFRVLSDGSDRELFYITERSNKSLTLIPRHQTFYREDAKTRDQDEYTETRFSIHNSRKNPDGNLIHRTLKSAKRSHDGYIWTEAIKKRSGFCPLFTTLSPTLDAGYYLSTNSTSVMLGSYSPSDFVLCFSVLLSAPDIKFRVLRPFPTVKMIGREPIMFYLDSPFDFYFVDHCFAQFRITVLVCFLSAPSNDASHTMHHQTFRVENPGLDDRARSHVTQYIKGLDEWMVHYQFKYADRESLLQKFIEDAEHAKRPIKGREDLFYLAHADRTSPAYRAYLAERRLADSIGRK